MDLVHHMMFVCEIMYNKYNINLYKLDDWKYARRCAATSSELDAKIQIRNLFDNLRREVGLSQPTYHKQLLSIKALNAEIEELLNLNTHQLISMVNEIHNKNSSHSST